MMLWLSGVVLAGDGELVLSWRGELGWVRLDAPGGEHLAPDAPTHLALESGAGRYTVDWGDLQAGVPVPLGAGGLIEGSVTYSLCVDGGTACRVVDAPFSTFVQGRKGEVVLPWVELVGGVKTDDELAAEASSAEHHDEAAAFDQAGRTGQPVLIDFGAEWCPPCQVLAAEVLEDPDNAGDLAPFVLLVVDADHPDSWALKDRYAVGGYPTVLVAAADGTEIGRHLGYSTETEFVGWLAGQGGPTLDQRLAGAAELDDAAKGALALALLASDRDDDAAALLDGVSGPDAALARFALAPDPAAVPGLIADAPDRLEDWIWSAYKLPLPDPVVADLRTLVAHQAALPGTDVSALAFLAGHFAADPADRAAFAALGARIVADKQTGVADHDRGYWLDQASFLEDAGQVDAAVAVLARGVAAYPDEFTWHYAIAGYLQRAARYDEALPHAEQGRALAYGDQALRAALREAQLLVAVSRTEDAQALLAEALAGAERPIVGTRVRTFRYLAALENLQVELDPP